MSKSSRWIYWGDVVALISFCLIVVAAIFGLVIFVQSADSPNACEEFGLEHGVDAVWAHGSCYVEVDGEFVYIFDTIVDGEGNVRVVNDD